MLSEFQRQSLTKINYSYCQDFNGDNLGQVEAVDVDDVAKWRQNLI